MPPTSEHFARQRDGAVDVDVGNARLLDKVPVAEVALVLEYLQLAQLPRMHPVERGRADAPGALGRQIERQCLQLVWADVGAQQSLLSLFPRLVLRHVCKRQRHDKRDDGFKKLLVGLQVKFSHSEL